MQNCLSIRTTSKSHFNLQKVIFFSIILFILLFNFADIHICFKHSKTNSSIQSDPSQKKNIIICYEHLFSMFCQELCMTLKSPAVPFNLYSTLFLHTYQILRIWIQIKRNFWNFINDFAWRNFFFMMHALNDIEHTYLVSKAANPLCACLDTCDFRIRSCHVLWADI